MMYSENHKSATRCLALALQADSASAWQELGRAFELTLTPDERGALSVAALLSLPPDHLADVVEAFKRVAGPPIPPLFSLSDEAATSWRDLRGQQFASGAVTQKLYGVASVLSLQLDGVVVAPELPVYTAASGVTISMTAAEANAFLDTGSLPSSATVDAYLNQYLPRDFLLKGFVVATSATA